MDTTDYDAHDSRDYVFGPAKPDNSGEAWQLTLKLS